MLVHTNYQYSPCLPGTWIPFSDAGLRIELHFYFLWTPRYFCYHHTKVWGEWRGWWITSVSPLGRKYSPTPQNPAAVFLALYLSCHFVLINWTATQKEKEDSSQTLGSSFSVRGNQYPHGIRQKGFNMPFRKSHSFIPLPSFWYGSSSELHWFRDGIVHIPRTIPMLGYIMTHAADLLRLDFGIMHAGT